MDSYHQVSESIPVLLFNDEIMGLHEVSWHCLKDALLVSFDKSSGLHIIRLVSS